MKKEEMIAAVAAKCDLSKVDAKNAMNAVFEVIAEELKAGNKVAISGFGTFEVSHREEREGRNPKTKEKIVIAASNSAHFKAAKALKESLNA